MQPTDAGVIQKIRETKSELNCWIEKENLIWKQRAKLHWFKEGDCNTSYFHAKASSRFQKNSIDGIFDEQKNWQDDESAVAKVFGDYYSKLFTSTSPTDFSEILDVV